MKDTSHVFYLSEVDFSSAGCHLFPNVTHQQETFWAFYLYCVSLQQRTEMCQVLIISSSGLQCSLARASYMSSCDWLQVEFTHFFLCEYF